MTEISFRPLSYLWNDQVTYPITVCERHTISKQWQRNDVKENKLSPTQI